MEIYLSKEEYDLYIESIKELEEKIIKNSKFYNGDIIAYEEINREINYLQETLKKRKNRLQYIKITTKDKNKANIGATVLASINFDGEFEENEYCLVTEAPVVNNNEISIFSPLGEKLYLSSVGTEFNYQVNNNTITGKVLNISYINKNVLTKKI